MSRKLKSLAATAHAAAAWSRHDMLIHALDQRKVRCWERKPLRDLSNEGNLINQFDGRKVLDGSCTIIKSVSNHSLKLQMCINLSRLLDLIMVKHCEEDEFVVLACDSIWYSWYLSTSPFDSECYDVFGRRHKHKLGS
ncbi:hypothetical protein VNO78_11129 [Psophocarpus tetragonolobus]|uniref:Uncharacterized protein n=1 Tax=Psophocarpus tetragonolobus TaxID=3891 RepID=A0AAN9SMK3_PSOTE